MKKTLIQNLSTNTVQLVVNQLLGLGIFYVLSTGLGKSSFGELNLALAVLLAAFNILSFGIDQLTIKKIAGGADASSIVSLYLVHVLVAGMAFYGLLLAGNFLLPHNNSLYSLLLFIGIGKLMIFFSSPFKQAANGLERFRLLAFMSVISNVIRCCGLILFAVLHRVNLHFVITIFITGDLAELSGCLILFARSAKIPVKLKWRPAAYKALLLEAMPQTGVALITSALSRFDWIFIGFIVSAVKLAEYSFAYKIFEMSTLPLLAIAPLLIPRFTRIFQRPDVNTEALKILMRAEMIIAAFTVLLLNLCWIPVIDALTAGKYGTVNVKTIFILSLCMPLLYFNNFFWTIYFAQGRLKMILTSFIITFLVNVILDATVIPFYKNEGAAFAFLAACGVQTIYYLSKNNIPRLEGTWRPLVITMLCAILSIYLSKMIFAGSLLTIPSGLVLFIVALVISAQVKSSDGRAIKALFSL